MKQVTTAQLVEILKNRVEVRGKGIFAQVKQITDARARKTNNPFNNISKVTELNVILNTEYARGVELQLEREGKDADTYVAGKNSMPLEFGPNNIFLGEFKGEPVLQYRPYDNSHPTVQYLADGRPVHKSVVEPWLPVAKERTEDNRQGTDKEIHIRKVYMKNILEMHIDGEVYKVVNN